MTCLLRVCKPACILLCGTVEWVCVVLLYVHVHDCDYDYMYILHIVNYNYNHSWGIHSIGRKERSNPKRCKSLDLGLRIRVSRVFFRSRNSCTEHPISTQFSRGLRGCAGDVNNECTCMSNPIQSSPIQCVPSVYCLCICMWLICCGKHMHDELASNVAASYV